MNSSAFSPRRGARGGAGISRGDGARRGTTRGGSHAGVHTIYGDFGRAFNTSVSNTTFDTGNFGASSTESLVSDSEMPSSEDQVPETLNGEVTELEQKIEPKKDRILIDQIEAAFEIQPDIADSFSDMTVTCKGQVFLGHRVFLCAQSVFFNTAIHSSCMEGISKSVDLQEDPRVVEVIIRLLYGKKPLLDDSTPKATDDRLEILTLAYKLSDFLVLHPSKREELVSEVRRILPTASLPDLGRAIDICYADELSKWTVDLRKLLVGAVAQGSLEKWNTNEKAKKEYRIMFENDAEFARDVLYSVLNEYEEQSALRKLIKLRRQA